MSFEKLGAAGDSLRLRNNEWYLARNFEQDGDVKIFRVNTLNQIEFFSVPSVGGDEFVLMSTFLALEARVAILEAIVGGITAGNTNFAPFTLTNIDIAAKAVTLPQTPIPGKCFILPTNGVPLIEGEDFVTSGTTLSWNGFELENIFEVGDRIIVGYLF